MCGLNRQHQRHFFAVRGDEHQHIASLPQGLHLARQRVFSWPGRSPDSVSPQGQRGQARALALKAPHQQAAEVLRQRHGGPQPGHQHLAAAGHTGQQGLHGRIQRFGQRLRDLVLQVGAVDEMLLNPQLLHGADHTCAAWRMGARAAHPRCKRERL